jgi:xylulokinase
MIIAFDIGTSGCKAGAYDLEGTNVAETFVGYPTSYPSPLQHEQRPADWWSAVVESCRTLVERASIRPRDVMGLGLSGQSLALVPVDRHCQPLLESVPIWSDARAQRQADEFFTRVPEVSWYLTTGNGFPPPLYTLFKLMWLREHQPDVFVSMDLVLGSKDFINARLTGQSATDHSYASGFGCYNLSAHDYDRDLLEAAGFHVALLPRIVPSTTILGGLSADAARALHLIRGTPVVAGGVDNACMAAGAREVVAGRIYCSLGSSNWITVSADRPILEPESRPYVFDHVVPGLYISALSTFGGGSSVNWLRESLFGGDMEIEALIELAAASPVGARGLICVPTLAGGTILEGGPEARGALIGLDLLHSRADVARAFLEGVAMSLRPAVVMMRRLAHVNDEMLLVGGGSKSALWRQILADVFALPVVRTGVDQQAATLGAAALVAVGVGAWSDFTAVDHAHQERDRDVPSLNRSRTYDRIFEVFLEAVAQQRHLAPQLAKLRNPETQGVHAHD